MLKGKKVILRPAKKSDIQLFVKWFNDPEVAQYLNIYPPITEMGEEKWLEELETTRKGAIAFFVIEDKKSKKPKPIGTCGLHEINFRNQHAELGIAIGDKKYWSKGYGQEAAKLIIEYGFNQLNLHSIFSCALSFNKRSINMHKKVGFKRQGRLRERKFRNGKFYDMILFDLLREEWNKKKKSSKNTALF